MTWLILGIFTAFFEAVKDVFGKQNLKKSDEYVVAWSLSFFSVISLSPWVIYTGIPALNSQFWFALLIGGSINAVTALLYIKAIKVSDLSLTVPLVALTPLFMLLTSPLIVGEYPKVFDYIGIFLIVTGSYLLNIKDKSQGYLAPFKALVKEPGPKLMLMVAFLWSITSNFDKIGVKNSSPIFWIFSIFGTMSILLLPILLHKTPNPSRKILKQLPMLAAMGFFNAIGVLCQMQALTLTLVVQVIAIKRTSVLMGVLFGHFIFKEKDIQQRLLGAAIMVFGVFVISL
ncbi:MAG: EamA family transporter [Oscillatoriales cyanobacterium]|uniref:EamA family transporter n=1 Tax=Microcoleus anatoxicus PTRS2 TaxID=2705321 RepID=A0ABU8YSJ0_9CYAN|nr:MAG: EamA family transporter [Oscillatoriales cyanobacterium]TAD93013.1 MAG: EamA family transporter [Oscillatoriales cyanobacterium]TAE00182.1 MAG: EamA family transporter [Oscillatoriales cyanobacterium]TAF01056.1 MAG: EamA family transporter [Oscillatoriales cyanobacterium]TAF32933.1 MAG: EamA family transporter [Oscillatoriales cyanobacterium]